MYRVPEHHFARGSFLLSILRGSCEPPRTDKEVLRPFRQRHYEPHVLGARAKNCGIRTTGQEAGQVWRDPNRTACFRLHGEVRLGFSPSNLRQMREFYLHWPILETVSGESHPSELVYRKHQNSRHCPDLRVNTKRHSCSGFPCQGRTMSACSPSKVKRRETFTKGEFCAQDGQSASTTARSQGSSMSARRSRGTRPR